MSFRESLELYETTFAPLSERDKMIASVFYTYGYLDGGGPVVQLEDETLNKHLHAKESKHE